MKRRILFILLPAMLLTGCNKDEMGGEPDTPGGTYGRIRFEIGFAPQDVATDGTPETKTATVPDFKTTWEVGDAIGIFAVKQGDPLATSGNPIHNVKLTRQNDGTWSGDTYWPNEANRNDRLDFYAYYPYSDGVDPTNHTFSVKSDQSGDGYSKSDLLLSTVANQSYGNAVQLQFKHALSLVQVEVKRELNVPHFDGDFTVTLTGAKPATQLGWSSDLTGAGTPTNIVMHKVAGMNYTYRALVPAQTLGVDSKVSFVQTISGKEIDMTYPGIASAALPAKGTRKYSVTLGWGIDPNHAYAVGDAYPHTGPAVGIVYWLDPASGDKHGKAVGLKETTGRWGVLGKDESADITGISSTTDGKTATRNLIAARKGEANFTTDYFIFNWIYQTMNSGIVDGVWYLPAIDELLILYSAYATYGKSNFNSRLTAVGGAALGNNFYWSSSEGGSNNAWLVYFNTGGTSGGGKNSGVSSRCVLDF